MAIFGSSKSIDSDPGPKWVQQEEIGATSAPLLSASFFIGDRCKAVNEDFMLCKKENGPGNEVECVLEGKRVTRCAISVIQDLQAHCAEEFRTHWDCLAHHNHELRNCRPAERALNKCAFLRLSLNKNVPGAPEDKEPVWERKKPYLRPGYEWPEGVKLEKKWANVEESTTV